VSSRLDRYSGSSLWPRWPRVSCWTRRRTSSRRVQGPCAALGMPQPASNPPSDPKRHFTAVSLHSLSTNRFAPANLFGRLANIAGDIDATYLESTAMFKAITGQDQITAEHKGRNAFDFTPWAVPVFSANKVPASADVTVGYLSRWLVIPFPHDFTGREDRGLDARLQTKDELQGIAAKALPALRRLMVRGDFELPDSGREARDEFARRVDQVRMWVTAAATSTPPTHSSAAGRCTCGTPNGPNGMATRRLKPPSSMTASTPFPAWRLPVEGT
jgi:hypothetical protein